MSAYRCPVCHQEPRVTDNTKKEGSNVVRTVVYECGTVLKIIQNGFRFKQSVSKSEKCIESILVAI